MKMVNTHEDWWLIFRCWKTKSFLLCGFRESQPIKWLFKKSMKCLDQITTKIKVFYTIFDHLLASHWNAAGTLALQNIVPGNKLKNDTEKRCRVQGSTTLFSNLEVLCRH